MTLWAEYLKCRRGGGRHAERRATQWSIEAIGCEDDSEPEQPAEAAARQAVEEALGDIRDS